MRKDVLYMTRRRKRKIMSTLSRAVLLGLFVVVVLLIIGSKTTSKASGYMNWIVSSGETVWSISKEITPEDRDLRYTIREIEEVNDLQNCTIRVGQVLTVPVYE